MDDFLHNLRSGKLKQADRNRRDYSDYKGPQRRAGSERRRPDYYAKVTSENFALVKDSLEVLAKCQRGIEDKLSKLNETGLRITVALETLAGIGKSHSLQSTITPPPAAATTAQPESIFTPPPELATTAPPEEHEKDTVQAVVPAKQKKIAGKTKLEETDKPRFLDIISTMRGEGKSWEKIARHMDEINIPTLSGKGKWRGASLKKFWDTNS